MEIEFSRDDVAQLFKASNGSELTPELMERYGLTLSPELVKSALRQLKLADLTLGDLAAMSGGSSTEEPKTAEEPSTAEESAETARVMPFRRRL